MIHSRHNRNYLLTRYSTYQECLAIPGQNFQKERGLEQFNGWWERLWNAEAMKDWGREVHQGMSQWRLRCQWHDMNADEINESMRLKNQCMINDDWNKWSTPFWTWNCPRAHLAMPRAHLAMPRACGYFHMFWTKSSSRYRCSSLVHFLRHLCQIETHTRRNTDLPQMLALWPRYL